MATELFKLMGKIYIEMDDAEEALKSFETLLTNAVTALQSIDTKLSSVNGTLNTMDSRLAEANGELKDLDSKAGNANSALNALDGNVDSLNGSMNTMDSRVNAVVTELGQLDSKATSASTQLGILDGKLQNIHNPFSSEGAFGAATVWLGNILEDLTYKALDLSWEFMKIGINFNASAESYQASFKTMLGVTEKEAEEIYEKLRNFAVETPYSMEGVTDSAVRLFNAGYNVDETLKMLEVMGNIANGDSAKMERLIKAWTDTKGYGRLRAQERNQFVENGVMIDQLLADYYQSKGMKIEADDIMARLEAKEVKEIDVLNALIMAQQKGGNFYNAMVNIMDTWGGQIEKTGDQLDETSGAFTLPFFDELKNTTLPKLNELLVELQTWSNENQETLSEIAASFSGFATDALGGLLDLFTYVLENKDTLLPILQAIGAAFAVSYVAEHPLVALMGALMGMAADNPEAFESLMTSLSELSTTLLELVNGALKTFGEFWTENDLSGKVSDFATTGINALTTGLQSLIDFFNTNEGALEGAMVLLGGLLMTTGHPFAGAAVLGTVYAEVWDNYKKGIVDPLMQDPVGAINAAQSNLENGTTIIHKMTGTGAFAEKEQEYLREPTWYESFVLWANGWNPEAVKNMEEAWGLVPKEEEQSTDGEGKRGGSLQWLQDNLHNRDLYFASTNGMPAGRYGSSDDSSFDFGGINSIPALIASMQAMVSQIRSEVSAGAQEGVAAGVSGITVTGTITTGNVMLNTGALVGQLTPKLNLTLGNALNRASRG